MGFLKPHIDRPGILNETPEDPQGYVTNDGMWAAVPLMGSKKFIVIHNGQQVHTAQNYKSAKSFILKQVKASKKTTSTLEKFL